MALLVETLVTSASWPEELEALGVERDRITPERLVHL
jgi:hypothetical protein